MTDEKILNAIREAERFIRKAKSARGAFADNKYAWNGTKETGACRRASMDLTRALAEMRRPM